MAMIHSQAPLDVSLVLIAYSASTVLHLDHLIVIIKTDTIPAHKVKVAHLVGIGSRILSLRLAAAYFAIGTPAVAHRWSLVKFREVFTNAACLTYLL